MKILSRAVIASALAASLLVFAFPPHGISVLAWCALAPFLHALRRGGFARSAFTGWVFGIVFIGGVFGWAPSLEEITFPRFALWLLLMSLTFLLFGVLCRAVMSVAGPWDIVAVPALWTSMEHLRSHAGFLSWPWNLLGHSQAAVLPVIQVASVAGVYGITFILAMSNQFLSGLPELLWKGQAERGARRPLGRKQAAGQALALTAAVLFVLVWGRYSLAVQGREGAGEALRVAVVQANVLAREDMTAEEQEDHLQAYREISLVAAGEAPRLIVWPASSLPAPPEWSRVVRGTVAQTARDTGAYLLVGGAGLDKLSPPREGYYPYANTEFLYAPSGRQRGKYHKVRQVPFNEYLPMQGRVRWPKWITGMEKSFLPGEEYTVFEAAGARFAAPICWENLFAGEVRRFVREGARFIVAATNDGWLGRTGGPRQLLDMTVFRAVENRLTVVRATTTGVSAFIGPTGKILDRVTDGKGDDLFVSGYIVRDIAMGGKSFYARHGDVFAWTCYGISLFFLTAALISFFRPPVPADETA